MPTEADLLSTAAPLDGSTPGSALRRAREASGQSIADIVQVIRFSPRQIEALERDDYASLPGSTAVRGLVRTYAKLLKLDAAPLLAQLDPAVPVPEADVRPPANMGEAEQSTIAERIRPRLVAVAIVFAVLALAAYWYAGLPDDGKPVNVLLGIASPEDAEGSNLPSAPSLATVAAPTPAIVAAAPAGLDAAVNPAVASGVPMAGLRIEFDDLSWIEVRDATQKVVFVGEHPAGTRQNVDGKPPFQLWIGKASGVRVFMGERSIDLKSHTREDIARLTVE